MVDTVTDVLNQVSSLVANYNANLSQFTTWQVGSPTGGAATAAGTGTGGPYYPLTDMSGTVRWFLCLPYYQSLITNSLSAAGIANTLGGAPALNTENLGGLSNFATARANLGLGALALQASVATALGYVAANKAGETFGTTGDSSNVVIARGASQAVRLGVRFGFGVVEGVNPAGSAFAPLVLGGTSVKVSISDGAQFDVVTTAGGKSLAAGLTITGTNNLQSGGGHQITLLNASGAAKAYIGTTAILSGAGTDDFNLRSDAASIVLGVGGTGLWNINGSSLRPVADNSYTLGASSYRVSTIYLGSSPNVSSDARLKDVRGGFTDAELDAWGEVQGCVYQYRDAVAQKGEAQARLHAGYVAQEVEAAFARHGLDAARYALWCSDPLFRTVTRTETRERQVEDEVTEEVEVVVMIDGRATRTTQTRTTRAPRTQRAPLFDADGAPVMQTPEPQPVTTSAKREVVQLVDGAPVLALVTVDEPVLDVVPVRDRTGAQVRRVLVEGVPAVRQGRKVVTPAIAAVYEDVTAAVPRMVTPDPVQATVEAPVMETYEVEITEQEDTGEVRLGLRYDQCAVFEAAWLRRELARLAA